MVKNIIIVCLVVICILLLLNRCGNNNIDVNWENALEDTVAHYKDKNGRLTSKISILEDVNKKRLSNLVTTDSTVKRLQREVKYYDKVVNKPGSSVTVYRTITTYDTVTSTTVEYDTVKTIDSFIVYPRYNFASSDNWITLKGFASKDSSRVNFEMEHEYTVVLGNEGGPFKNKPVALVTDSNPYSKTTDMRAFRIKGYRQKRFGLGVNIGYGIGFVGKKVIGTPYIGIGINYNILEF